MKRVHVIRKIYPENVTIKDEKKNVMDRNQNKKHHRAREKEGEGESMYGW